MKICQTHKVEAVLKEGISKKTNKPYSFDACPERTADGGYCPGPLVEGPAATNSASVREFQASLQENRSERIERQHSQDMAIEFLKLSFTINPEAFKEIRKPLKEMVKDYTDYFQADLNPHESSEVTSQEDQ